MKAEIISVGTELLLGHTVNTDAAFIARELAALGIDLMNVETVGDNPGRLREVLETALSRSDLVITSGGLGPTLDDLTKKTIADTLGLPLVEDQDSLARLKEYFGTRPMRDNQLVQALLPKGATALKNTVGTAPGCFVAAGKEKFVMMLPGPPRELNPMFLNEAVPLLEKHTGAAFATYMLRTFNQSEGDAALKLGDLCTQANPTVATYLGAHNEMFVRVTAKGKDKASARKLALPVVEKVKNLLGDVIYGVNVESLEEVVVHELAERHEEVATAESCTGGLLAKRITDIPGSSAVFRTGLVTYANATKTRLLGVPEDMLREHGAVSEEVARCMAEEAQARAGADYGIGITGIAGPDGGTTEKPLGLVWIALATKEKTYVKRLLPKGRYPGRGPTRQKSAGTALDMLRRYLEGKPVTD